MVHVPFPINTTDVQMLTNITSYTVQRYKFNFGTTDTCFVFIRLNSYAQIKSLTGLIKYKDIAQNPTSQRCCVKHN